MSSEDLDEFEVAMRRHGIEVLPEAVEAARRVFDEISRAARMVRRPRPIDARTAYVFRVEGNSRKATDAP